MTLFIAVLDDDEVGQDHWDQFDFMVVNGRGYFGTGPTLEDAIHHLVETVEGDMDDCSFDEYVKATGGSVLVYEIAFLGKAKRKTEKVTTTKVTYSL